jgi:hypothetical protein
MAKMILKSGLLQIVFAALLLAAQHGALTHRIRHLQDNLPAQSQKHNGGKQTSQSGLCDFHVAFVQVLGALSSTTPPPAIAANAVERSLNHFSLAYPANLVIPASRGPPVLL